MKFDYRELSQAEADRAIEIAKDYLPDDAELVLLSFTGGRAFGWGNQQHDVDIHGWFAYEEWFRTAHSDTDLIDMTVTNVRSLDRPEIRYTRFKNYYDKSKPIYIHPEFDFEEDFMRHITPDRVLNVFPYDISLQISRMDNEFNARNALHTYKEILIPLHYLRTKEIESNVVHDINRLPEYQYDGMEQCVTQYKDNPHVAIDEELVRSEIDELYEQLEDEVYDKTDYRP